MRMMKKIIFLIVLFTISAIAQPRKRTQWLDLSEAVKDSIRNAAGGIGDSLTVLRGEIGDTASVYITDSLDTFTGVNGIVFGTTTNDFGQKIVKDVTTLEAYQPDSLGTTVYLKEVVAGGYGGGEVVFVDSTDLKALIGIAVPDDGIIFTAPGADRVWVRKTYYENRSFITPDWYGAKHDGTTDDSLALQSAINFANNYGGIVQLGEDVYAFNGPLIVNPRDENDGLIIRGVGGGLGGKSNLTVLGNTGAIQVNKAVGGASSYSALIEISSLTITGPGKATSTGKGIELDSTSFIYIRGNAITGFQYAIYAQQPNTHLVENNYITSNVWGCYYTGNVNGNTFSGNIISQSDSAGIHITTGYGNRIIGGEFGRNWIAVDLYNGAFASLEGVNLEADNFWEFRLNTSCILWAKNFKSIRDASTGPKLKLAYLTGSSALHLDGATLSTYDMTNDSNHVWVAGNSNFVTAKNMSAINIVRVYNAQTSSHYYALPYITYPYNQGITADSTHRGQLYMTIQRGSNASPVTTEEDYIQYKRRTWTGAYVTSRVGVEDRYFSATGASHAYSVGSANYVGYKGFDLGGGTTDSVDVTITVDSLITVYSAVATVYDDLTGGVQIPCVATHLSGVANTTTIVFRVWYKWNVGATNTGLRLHYNIWGKKYYE